MDRRAHLLEGPAPTDVGDRLVDVLVGRLRLLIEQRRDRHHHSPLAVAALRYVVRDPGLLHLGELAILREALDRRDLLAGGIADRERAGARRNAVHMDRAGAALRAAPTVFRPGQSDLFA